MNTRRQFLTNLLAAAGIPLVARALPKTQPPLMLPDGGPRPYKGPAIKVPSNRQLVQIYTWPARPQNDPPSQMRVIYSGDWDGTFKLEEGCTNPAYILADLMEQRRAELALTSPEDADDSWYRPYWPMLYDWGCHCDTLSPHRRTVIYQDGSRSVLDSLTCPHPRARCEVNLVSYGEQDAVRLRETLRMCCLQWQSTDPRYRTSWPGVPYPICS